MGSVIPSGNLAAGSWKPITKPDRGHRRRLPQSAKRQTQPPRCPSERKATQGTAWQKAINTLERKRLALEPKWLEPKWLEPKWLRTL